LHAVGTNERPLSHHVAGRASDGCRFAGSQAVTLLVKLVCGKLMRRVRFAVGFLTCNHGQHFVLIELLPREDHVHNHGSAAAYIKAGINLSPGTSFVAVPGYERAVVGPPAPIRSDCEERRADQDES
jgi:hypothetical protein